MSESYYVGWIPGNPCHLRKWRKLGVKGKMKFRFTRHFPQWGLGVFEHCFVDDKETLDRLVAAGLPNPESFSLVLRDSI